MLLRGVFEAIQNPHHNGEIFGQIDLGAGAFHLLLPPPPAPPPDPPQGLNRKWMCARLSRDSVAVLGPLYFAIIGPDQPSLIFV